MKKCPSCYAIMKESNAPTAAPKLQHPAQGTREVSPFRVRYECSQCGHMEESFPKIVPAQKAR